MQKIIEFLASVPVVTIEMPTMRPFDELFTKAKWAFATPFTGTLYVEIGGQVYGHEHVSPEELHLLNNSKNMAQTYLDVILNKKKTFRIES